MNQGIKTSECLRIFTTTDVAAYLPVEAAALRRMGIALVHMDYDAQIGFRHIGNPLYLNSSGDNVSCNIDSSLAQEVAVFLRELVELRFAGWDCEGARGSFVWVVGADTLEHYHVAHMLDVEDDPTLTH